MPETILEAEYSDEMRTSYINYSMSVITARAVPDIRDGLKPVQRRVLYAMNQLGLNSDKPHKKSARIVGDAMGKYHPHGDSSIYDALVVMSQDFKKGMALIDGHGNFGSIEGDGAAAMRYTEARLKKFTQEVYLKDLDKNVVDFIPNYDETDTEPAVLPVRIPNFLVNGSEGIAVGMTTSTPTHNLAEVIDALELYMDRPEATTEELMEKMPGPDFPTGGIIANKKDLLDIYETGKGKIRVRGRAEFKKAAKKSEHDRIEITEIPYTMIGADIGKFLQSVADLAEKKVFPDILDISNHSDKDGIRIVIELRNGADGEKILNGLYKKTKLEDTFGVNMLAIVDKRPEVLNLRRILEESLKFQLDVNRRKYTTLLEKEKKNREIQEGLIKAVDVIDLIIEIIRGSQKLEMAKACLTEGRTEGIKFKSEQSEKDAAKLHFTDIQAQAILDLRLAKLIGLEILALKKLHKETIEKIRLYERLLSSDTEMKTAIREDLKKIREEFGLPRKTVLLDEEETVFEVPKEEARPVVLSISKFGYAKAYDMPVYEKNREAIDEESEHLIFLMSDSRVLIFTDTGNCHYLKMQDVPNAKMKDKGVPVDNITNFVSQKERILLMDSYENLRDRILLFATAHAMIKQVQASEFDSIKKTVASTKFADDDRLVAVRVQRGAEIVLVTKDHYALRFRTSDVSLYKKTSVGVRGLKLGPGDEVTDVYDFDPSERYVVRIGKKAVDLGKLKLKKRDGKADLVK